MPKECVTSCVQVEILIGYTFIDCVTCGIHGENLNRGCFYCLTVNILQLQLRKYVSRLIVFQQCTRRNDNGCSGSIKIFGQRKEFAISFTHVEISLKFRKFVGAHLRGVPAIGQCAHQNPAYPAKPKTNPEILFVVVAFFFGGFKEPFGNEIVEGR